MRKPADSTASTFVEVSQRAVPRLLRYAARHGVPGADAEDLVATTLEIAWRRYPDLSDESVGVLFGILKRLLWESERRFWRRRRALDRLTILPDAAVDDEEARLEVLAVRDALHRMSRRDSEVLLLVAWGELSGRELAAAMGCSEQAARVRLHRARGRLRALLEPSHGKGDVGSPQMEGEM